MTIERTEVLWLDARSDYSVDEVMRMSGLPLDLIEAMIECGALPTAGGAAAEPAVEPVVQRAVEQRTTVCFTGQAIVLARAASRLREHFELDDNGLAVALSLLRRIHDLEMRLTRRPEA